jgi:predicted alpha/beta-hydrolase family hydrolase
LLIVLAELFSAAGVRVLRCDLPFRQKRPHGPPSSGSAQQDQDGLHRAVTLLRERAGGRIFLGGVSYGGRQSSMLAASESSLVPALLLLSYPLHPPGRSSQLRTAHFPRLRTPALFVHGTKDPFGSLAEMGSAISLIPAKTKLLPVEGAGHGLLTSRSKSKTDAVSPIVESFLSFVGTPQ